MISIMIILCVSCIACCYSDSLFVSCCSWVLRFVCLSLFASCFKFWFLLISLFVHVLMCVVCDPALSVFFFKLLLCFVDAIVINVCCLKSYSLRYVLHVLQFQWFSSCSAFYMMFFVMCMFHNVMRFSVVFYVLFFIVFMFFILTDLFHFINTHDSINGFDEIPYDYCKMFKIVFWCGYAVHMILFWSSYVCFRHFLLMTFLWWSMACPRFLPRVVLSFS